MKTLSSLMFAGLIAVSTSGFTQSGGAKDTDMNGMHDHGAAHAPAYRAEGTLKKIDAAAGTVMLAHGPIPSLKWPPMTMAFDVRDRKLLQGLKAEQRVQFEFVQEGNRYVITSIK
jgi:Cu(I)/Ag(I) efflux system periplasmic protein CusF